MEITKVVTVLGLSVAIALANFLESRNSTRVKACINNLRVIDGAKAQWALEKNKPSSSVPTVNDIIPFLRDDEMAECPADGASRIRSLPRISLSSLWPEGHTLKNLNADDDPNAD